jgi:hypothetical protein
MYVGDEILDHTIRKIPGIKGICLLLNKRAELISTFNLTDPRLTKNEQKACPRFIRGKLS